MVKDFLRRDLVGHGKTAQGTIISRSEVPVRQRQAQKIDALRDQPIIADHADETKFRKIVATEVRNARLSTSNGLQLFTANPLQLVVVVNNQISQLHLPSLLD